VVGLGPGSDEHLTPAARDAIADADVIVGYVAYVRLVSHLLSGKEILKTGMTEEIGRARAAVQRAQGGAKVALISSGDAGVYGMGALVFQMLAEIGWKRDQSPQVRLIPGITAINSCASLVGAPLGHDFCSISLSDLLTPWPVIARRIEAAASADFVIGLYNPASGHRSRQIVEAQNIISKYRQDATPVALVHSAYRKKQDIHMTDLAHMLDHDIGMLTTVLIGSSNTFMFEDYMITPRGYTNKYTLDGAVLPGQKPGVSLVGAEAPRGEGSFAPGSRAIALAKSGPPLPSPGTPGEG